MDVPRRPRRISVVGSTGSGKTRLARELAQLIGASHIELDAIEWQPNWTPLPNEEFRARVAAQITAPTWVVDGNDGGAGIRDIVWEAADTIVWLDYSLWVIYRRLWSRTNARIRDKKEVWPGTGNLETFRGAYLSTESLYLWVLRSYWRRRRNYPALLALPQYAHAEKLRFRTPAEADRWLDRQRAAARI